MFEINVYDMETMEYKNTLEYTFEEFARWLCLAESRGFGLGMSGIGGTSTLVVMNPTGNEKNFFYVTEKEETK